jgi:hypothetical protein
MERTQVNDPSGCVETLKDWAQKEKYDDSDTESQ